MMTKEEVVARRGHLQGLDLRGHILTDAHLRGADMEGACLIRADLSRADLRGANLRNADLREANLNGAILRETDLRGTRLDYARGSVCAGYDVRGYRFVGVAHDDGPRVVAGCRWFTIEQAVRHWVRNRDALARVEVIRRALGGPQAEAAPQAPKAPQDIAEAVGVLLGSVGSRPAAELGTTILRVVNAEHRTIQQGFWSMLLLAQCDYADSPFDARNEQAVDLARRVRLIANQSNYKAGLARI